VIGAQASGGLAALPRKKCNRYHFRGGWIFFKKLSARPNGLFRKEYSVALPNGTRNGSDWIQRSKPFVGFLQQVSMLAGMPISLWHRQ
jgi:hypothetical protein